MADLHLEKRYEKSARQFLYRFTEVTEQIHDLDSKQAANFFVRGLVNGSLTHERFIETPSEDINKVRARAEGIFRVEESRQRMAKNATIAVAQNIVANEPSKHYEEKRKMEEKPYNVPEHLKDRSLILNLP